MSKTQTTNLMYLGIKLILRYTVDLLNNLLGLFNLVCILDIIRMCLINKSYFNLGTPS
jgi:hypothetical protein